MKKRNYLPESNGLYKVNMKEPVSKATIRKRILTVICLIIFGFMLPRFTAMAWSLLPNQSLYAGRESIMQGWKSGA